jgi:hypothetical protein
MTLDPLHELIINFIAKTNTPIFLTGKAGTGKTTFLRHIRSQTLKNLIVVAPTAVAAINAGGVTIHSFFQVPFGPTPPVNKQLTFTEFSGKSFGAEKTKLIKCLDLLIIDEISMVRADTIDYIDRVLRHFRGSNQAFGGVQLLMIGDLYQLPPVYQNDWHVLGKFYKGPYFFDSLIFKDFPLLTFELEKVHRQNDPTFIQILNEIRNGAISENLLQKLNEQHQAAPTSFAITDHVTLTTHNPLVKKINDERLANLKGETHRFLAKVTGDFPKEAYPTEEELLLKEGAMVMFVKNDSSGKKQFYNGRTAIVNRIIGEVIRLTFLDDNSEFEATQEIWENTKYALSANDQKVTQTSAGTFTQFPLRLAWAITIHKSQGLSFDKAVIDVGAAFAHGQTYVALSRCRTLDGLILKEKVEPKNIITDPSVAAFMQRAQMASPTEHTLVQMQVAFETELLSTVFDFSTIHATWDYFSAVLFELATITPMLDDKIKEAQKLLVEKLAPIGARFIRQELPVGSSIAALKHRLIKAAAYFLPNVSQFQEQIIDLHQLLAGVPYHTDYFPTLNQLIELLQAKVEILKLMPELGNVDAINKVSKHIATNYQPLDNWTKPQVVAEAKIENPAIYASLIAWRNETAVSRKLMSYHVISDQAMVDIAARLPRTLTQLSKIKNVGEGKAAEFGDQLLKIIRQHFGENELFS